MRPVVAAGTLAALPLLGLQGLWVRLRTPVLPEAGPPTTGMAYPPYITNQATLHLLVIGESTAAGVGAPSHAVGLTGCTAAALATRLNRPVAWRALGRSGATAADVRRELLPSLEQPVADVVLVALGVNDTIRRTAPAAWHTEIAALVTDLRRRFPPTTIVLAGVPAMARFPALPSPLRHFLGAHGTRLDRELADLAAATPGVCHCPTPLPDPYHFASDRFHPGPAGYAAWGEIVAACLEY
ncbi:MAG: SGNH/GDSL hydrolase family protein [Caldilineaceae bacterium]|nr:SGNH/GDSL hydrolase family protein [Caldilineaceae bacterium]